MWIFVEAVVDCRALRPGPIVSFLDGIVIRLFGACACGGTTGLMLLCLVLLSGCISVCRSTDTSLISTQIDERAAYGIWKYFMAALLLELFQY